MTRLHRKSDSQANADALARRGATYADEHAASWQVRFDRSGSEPRHLTGLVVELRRAYRDEIPSRLHKHEPDGGGTPAYSAEFAALLYGSPHATDRTDTGGTEVYRTPVRHALAAMIASREEATRQMGRIVARVVVGGDQPDDAVRHECPGGLSAWMARAVADRALRVFWRRASDVRLDLVKTTTAA